MLFLQTVLFAAVPLIAMVNPVAEVPLFLMLAGDRATRERHRAALTVAIGVFFVLTVAAAEVTVGLAIIIGLFRAKGTVDVTRADEMKG